MPFARLIVTAALTVALLGAGVAHADAPWSAPVTIASGNYGFSQPALAFTGDGHALALLGGGAGQLTRILAAAPGASTFTEIGRTVPVAGPALYGRRGVAFLRTPLRAPATTRSPTKFARLGVSLGAVPGSLGRFEQLARVDVSQSGQITAGIAADPRGNVAAAWVEPRGGRSLLRLALRPPGHAFGRATTLGEATGYLDDPPLGVAYGANGDLVVAFQRSRVRQVSESTLEFAVRVKRYGRRFGPIQSLGPSRGFSSLATAVAPTGAAVVAWGTQDGGEGVETPWTVRAAMLRSGARRFSKTQLLDPGRVARPVAGVSAAIGRDGTATVAWSGVAARQLPYPVRVATAGPVGRFGATMQLAPNGETLGLVTARDGTTTVLWGSVTDFEAETLDGIFAARRPDAASRFAVPEAVSPREPVARAAIALDPQSGRPAALWVGSPGAPPGTPLDYGSPLEPQYSTRGG